MPTYKVGVAGPVPLEDGRVVTAEQGPFELEITAPHDEDLLDRGVILLAAGAPADPKAPAPPAPVQTPTPAAGEKAGE
jgi:hypothetical protein